MKYVILQSGGKQYKAAIGDVLELERLQGEKDQKISFEEVLLYADDGAVKIGTPLVNGVSVTATILDHVKGEKIRVAKFKAKSRYRRVTGHRQSLTRVKIEDIAERAAKRATSTEKVEDKAEKPKASTREKKTQKTT